MSRIQLALTVADIDAAVVFYSKLFDATPTKRRPGYANFAIADPPLKLVLIEGTPSGSAGTLNHLGIEVDTPEAVRGAAVRLAAAGLAPELQDATTCCYAVQDKAWVTGPDGDPWEVYAVLADAPEESGLGCGTSCC